MMTQKLSGKLTVKLVKKSANLIKKAYILMFDY